MLAPRTASDPCMPRQSTHAGRILFVEDHRDTRHALSRLLEALGYTVRTADSCAAAIKLAECAECYDLLIADVGLPDGDGWALLDQLRHHWPELRGIVVSGYGTDDDVRHSTTAGYAQHLTKPVTMEVLCATIDAALANTPAR